MLEERRTVNSASDPIWWAVAAGLSVVALYLPRLLGAGASNAARLVVAQAALFFSGALVGCFRRHRVWRWAVAAFLAIAARDVILAANTKLAHVDAARFAGYLAANSGAYLVQALPVLLGALLGSLVFSAGLD
jgi:hypothetical protein